MDNLINILFYIYCYFVFYILEPFCNFFNISIPNVILSDSFFLFFIFYLIIILIYVLIIVLKVAITTLYERKVLGRTQLREGPLFVGFAGFLQPFADAFKLLDKEIITPVKANKILHLGAPIAVFFISILA